MGGWLYDAAVATRILEPPRLPAAPAGRTDRPSQVVAARVRAAWPGLRLHLAVVGALLAVAVALWWRVWLAGDPGSTISCQCGDPAQYLWFIEWVPWSLTHWHDPFLSQAIYAGQGGSNTLELSDLFPSLAVSPVTLLFGPVAAFNVVVTLVPVVNGWSMFVLLRSTTRVLAGQVAGALLYGFSPYVVHDLPYGHFNIDLLFFPPLALWCLYDLLVAGRHRPGRTGALLGLLVVAQFFTGTELLAMTVVVGAVAAVALAYPARRLLRERRKALGRGLGVAAATAAVLLAYPAWFALAGPRHVVGVPWIGTPFYGVGWNGVLDVGLRLPLPTLGGYFGGEGAPSTYLGIPLVALLAVGVVLWGRRRLGWYAAVVAFAGWAFSLGAAPVVGFLRAVAPWRLFAHLPLVSDVLPPRFALFSDFGAAVLLAVGLDVLVARRHDVRLLALGTLAVAGCLVPVALQEHPFAVHDDPVPAWFTTVAPSLPHGTELLVMPVATSGATQSMAWQADDRFSFRMVGGEAEVPGADGRRSEHVDPIGGSFGLVVEMSWGLGPEPAVTPQVAAAARSAFAAWGVQGVVVTDQTRYPPYAVGFVTEVLGRPPVYQDGTWDWYGLGQAPPLRVPATWLRACAAHASGTPLAVPTCVAAHALPGAS